MPSGVGQDDLADGGVSSGGTLFGNLSRLMNSGASV